MKIRELLIFYREKVGLTQSELAEKMGLSRQSISKWENGNNFPDIENLVFLSELYGVSIDELVRGSAYFPKPYKVKESRLAMRLAFGLLSAAILMLGLGIMEEAAKNMQLVFAGIFVLIIVLGFATMNGYWAIDHQGLKVKKQLVPTVMFPHSNFTPRFFSIRTEFIPYDEVKYIEIVYRPIPNLAVSASPKALLFARDIFHIKVVEKNNRETALEVTTDFLQMLPQAWAFFDFKGIELIDKMNIIEGIKEGKRLYEFVRSGHQNPDMIQE